MESKSSNQVKRRIAANRDSIIIGDDGHRYRLEGQQLTLKEADNELTTDTIVLICKQ
ncbi:MAG: hypothetical protein ACLVJN_10065 [Streptococcus parasanguinis]